MKKAFVAYFVGEEQKKKRNASDWASGAEIDHNFDHNVTTILTTNTIYLYLYKFIKNAENDWK